MNESSHCIVGARSSIRSNSAPETYLSAEATTRVEFFLEEVEGGTVFKVVETEFDHLQLLGGTKVFGMASRGWEQQMASIENYVATH